MQVISATLWKNKESEKYIYDLFCSKNNGAFLKKWNQKQKLKVVIGSIKIKMCEEFVWQKLVTASHKVALLLEISAK